MCPQALPESWQNISGFRHLPEKDLAALGWLPVLEDATPAPPGQVEAGKSYTLDRELGVVQETTLFSPAPPDWSGWRTAVMLSSEWARVRSAAGDTANYIVTLLFQWSQPGMIAIIGSAWVELVQQSAMTQAEKDFFLLKAQEYRMPNEMLALLQSV